MTFRLGVLVGLRSEARTLVEARGIPRTVIEISGARPELAHAGARRLVAAGCTHLLSFGLAGALSPGLSPGCVLLPELVMTSDGRRWPVDVSWRDAATRLVADLSPIAGAILAGDEPIASCADKASLLARSGAVAVDMESHHLAEAAQATGLPFLVIRVIADTADQILPPAALVGVTPDGNTDLAAVLGSVFRRPAQIPALIQLGRAASAAHRSLKRCDLLGGSLGFGAAGLTLGGSDPL